MSAPVDRTNIWQTALSAIAYASDGIGELANSTNFGRSVEYIVGDLEKAEIAFARAIRDIKTAKAEAKRAERRARGHLPFPNKGAGR